MGGDKFVVDASGNVGIGTTSPSQKLSVLGHCVTGDSELVIENGETLRVDEVKGGEKILSLDEKTGKLVPAKIQKLWDMGVKPIYKIETEDGKTIRTTGNHPYFVLNKWEDLAVNKKSAFWTDSLGFQFETIAPDLTFAISIADTDICQCSCE